MAAGLTESYDELYDSDTIANNIVYGTFYLNLTVEDRPRDQPSFDNKSESDVEIVATEVEYSDCSGHGSYISSCQDGTDESAIELVSVTLPRKSNQETSLTANSGVSSEDVVSNSKITDYFLLRQFTTIKEYPAFLKQYNPTSIHCHPARLKRSVVRPSCKRTLESEMTIVVKDRGVGKEPKTKKAGTYKSYSYT